MTTRHTTQTIYRVNYRRGDAPLKSKKFGQLAAAKRAVEKLRKPYRVTPAHAKLCGHPAGTLLPEVHSITVDIGTITWGGSIPLDYEPPPKTQRATKTPEQVREFMAS